MEPREVAQLGVSAVELVTIGALSGLETEVTAAAEHEVEQVRKAVPKQTLLNTDETGWQEQGKRPFL